MVMKDALQKFDIRSERVIPTVITSFFFSFTILFFSPSYLYYRNILEIPYLYSDIVLIFVVLSLATGAIISIILLFLKGKLHQRAVVLVFALGLLFWIQGHILVWNYGLLDGREIVWSAYLLNGIIDSAIWIVILGVALFKAPSFYKSIAVASIILIVVQAGGLAAEAYLAPEEPSWKYWSLEYNDTAMFEFSQEQNVIVLVLDAFRSDIFQEIIDEDDSYREMFEGFTYFRNAAGGYPYTDASIPLILTGEYNDNSKLRSDYIKSTFLNTSIPRLLKKNDYRIDMYPLKGLEATVYISNETASNVATQERIKVKRTVDGISGAMEIQRLTFFRLVPHFLKRYFYFMPFIGTGGQGDGSHDLVFYNMLVSNTTSLNDEKIFKFYHNLGPHPPLILNAQLHDEKLPFNNTGYKEQAKASLRISGELIKQLKKHNVYDNSLIFIVGDHGAYSEGHGVKDVVNTELLNKNISLDGYRYNSKVVESGIPLILVKRFNSTGDLVISDVPVSLSDIPQTIASELQLPNAFSGQSIFSINESDIRERKYFQYLLTEKPNKYYMDLGYFPPMEEYKIIGHSWFSNSWEPTVRVYEPGKGLIPVPVYEINTLILFGENGNAQPYQLVGWSFPGEGYTWTDAYYTVLAIKMKKPDSDLTMKIVASPYLKDGAETQQRVNVLVNGHPVGKLVFDKPGVQEKTVVLPNAVLDDEIQYIAFELPDAISPKELGRSQDGRNLALALQSFKITELH